MTAEAWGSGPDPQAIRVLLVEDDEMAYRRVADMLHGVAHARFRVEREADLAGGLARLERGGFDVCLVDQGLPDGDGLELVRAAERRSTAVPVILLSDGGSLALDLEAMAEGAADFLEKCRIDASLLERSIRYALARRQRAEHLNHLAQFDELTGLANRALFRDRLARALAWGRRHGRLVAVMVLDLNGFKTVNDRLGHAAGDQLLRHLANRLRRRLRETDTVARLGGDEFALVIENLAKAEHAALVARKILDVVTPPLVIDGREVRVTASLGVALHPEDGDDAERLLKGADAAMYRAKAEGGNLCRFCSSRLERRVQRGALLECDLRRGLADGEFVLHFQPQVTLASDALAISGLIRWCHPELGLIGPERFLALAEDSGLLEPLTDRLLAAGCRQLAHWREQGLRGLRLALPLLSRQQLAWADLAGRLRRHLDDAGIAAASALEIELAEDLLLADAEQGGTGLAALKELGVRLALEGFGRGPTSLRGLQLGVLDTLKVDQELLKGVPLQPERAAVLGAIVELGRTLGLRVVAEGVDDRAQLAFLRRRGCSAVQAFMSCPPLPAEACTRWLREAARRDRGPDGKPPALPVPVASASLPAAGGRLAPGVTG